MQAANRDDPFVQFLKKIDADPPRELNKDLPKQELHAVPVKQDLKVVPVKPEEQGGSADEGPQFLFAFLTDLVYCIKNTLFSINNYLFIPAEKLTDSAFRDQTQALVREDIRKIDLILNSLLNYIHINSPIAKANTLFVILEEVLEANEKQFRKKNIKIIKECEKDLPETLMHNEQVRFVLNSLIQYSVLSIPANGSIRFVMKYVLPQKPAEDRKTSWERNGGAIFLMISFTGDNKTASMIQNGSPDPARHKEEPIHLILKLVKESVQEKHGMMKIEYEDSPPRTHITLRLNIERRKSVYYEPVQF